MCGGQEKIEQHCGGTAEKEHEKDNQPLIDALQRKNEVRSAMAAKDAGTEKFNALQYRFDAFTIEEQADALAYREAAERRVEMMEQAAVEAEREFGKQLEDARNRLREANEKNLKHNG